MALYRGWRARLADIRQLDGLAGQVSRSGKQTMGLFLSVDGWSGHVVPLLKQNPDKNIILMEGLDLRGVLAPVVEGEDSSTEFRGGALPARVADYWPSSVIPRLPVPADRAPQCSRAGARDRTSVRCFSHHDFWAYQ